MLQPLFDYFHRSWTVNDEERALITSLVLPKTFKKGEFLQREGEIVRYGAFVACGCLRSYHIDSKGNEHVVQFAPENWWISDKSAFTEDSRASFFIDAIEDSDIILMDFKAHTTLIEKIPGFANMFRKGIQKRGAVKDKRIVQSLSATAEERYNDFVETYPSIVQRVPQHMLASYLGVRPETVSRIRKHLSLKK